MWSHDEAHPGEFLRARFLEPLGVSAAELARSCKMPRSRVSAILAGRRAISADTALRLAAYFRMEPEAWLELQAAWDLAQTSVPEGIEPLDPPGFLLGPRGATKLPRRVKTASPRVRYAHAHERSGAEQPSVASDGGPPPSAHQEVRYPDGTRALVAGPKPRQ